MHHQQRDRSGRYPRNAARLPHGFGLVGVEFLLHFGGQTFHFGVVDFGGQAQGFDVAAAVDFFLLAVDVALVFDLDFHLFRHVFRQRGGRCGVGQGHQGGVVEIGAAQQVVQVGFAA